MSRTLAEIVLIGGAGDLPTNIRDSRLLPKSPKHRISKLRMPRRDQARSWSARHAHRGMCLSKSMRGDPLRSELGHLASLFVGIAATTCAPHRILWGSTVGRGSDQSSAGIGLRELGLAEERCHPFMWGSMLLFRPDLLGKAQS